MRAFVTALLLSGASAFSTLTPIEAQRRADAKAIALGGVIALSGTELLPQGAPIASFVNRQVGSPFTLPAFSMMGSELLFLCAVLLVHEDVAEHVEDVVRICPFGGIADAGGVRGVVGCDGVREGA